MEEGNNKLNPLPSGSLFIRAATSRHAETLTSDLVWQTVRGSNVLINCTKVCPVGVAFIDPSVASIINTVNGK